MKIKLTKGELKRQRGALRQYRRYLPTLQLKKQQLQIEIIHQTLIAEQKRLDQAAKQQAAEVWAGLLAEPEVNLGPWIKPKEVLRGLRNIAGINVPVFKQAEFNLAEYDLFIMPLWVEAAIKALREIVSLSAEIRIFEEATAILRSELRITTQRVNLFEKVKIPEAEEAIRQIKIYIGDQIANAVGRSKIAKRKIEELILQGVA
ncbi:V-type ATP synthase subunit D [Candidatus Omnitrophota bacterium]